MNNFLLFIAAIIIPLGLFSQENPVTWKIDYNTKSSSINYNANIGSKWHLYSAHLPNPDEGPLPTEFKYDESIYFELSGKIIESNPVYTFDDNFGVDVSYFENTAEFSQKIKLTSSKPFM